MMELKNIMKLLGGLGIPIAYHHFAEGESPEPPFLIYLTPGSHNFSADGMVYFKVKQLDVELYTDKKDLALEEKNWRRFWMHRGFSITKQKHISNQKNCMKCCTNWRYSNGK